MTNYDNLWQLMTTYDSLWQLLTAYDNFWQLLTTFDNFWPLLTTYTCTLCKLSSSQDLIVALVIFETLPKNQIILYLENGYIQYLFSTFKKMNIFCIQSLSTRDKTGIVSGSLPSTPSIKPVEVWLLFNMSFPFLVILEIVFLQVTFYNFSSNISFES